MVDTHAHLTMKDFDKDREEIVNNFEEEGIEFVIEVGYNVESSKRAVDFASSHERIYSAIGVHPHEVKDLHGDWLSILESFSKEKKVVAIGEVGLDYFRDLSPRSTQRESFDDQLALAEKLDLPVIFHIRDAYVEAREIMKRHKVRGVVHSFNGTLEDAKDFLNMGLYIGVGGIATYKKSEVLREIISTVPLTRILTETDSPYLFPATKGIRKRRNEPKYVRFVLEVLATLFDVSFETVESVTAQNAKELFGL